MKTILFYAFLLAGSTITFSQNDQDVQTQTIKLEDFITYSAAYEASEIDHKLYLAVEVGVNGFEAEQRFYLEQGIKLLSKRLPETSFLAIGTYGGYGTILQPYTPLDQLSNMSNSILQSQNNQEQLDGIDLAFQMAFSQYQEGANNTVLIIRNNITSTTLVYKGETNSKALNKQETKEKTTTHTNQKLGGAIALTALSILPEVLDIIKD